MLADETSEALLRFLILCSSSHEESDSYPDISHPLSAESGVAAKCVWAGRRWTRPSLSGTPSARRPTGRRAFECQGSKPALADG